MLSLSGGLDSAIVLGSIKRARKQPAVVGFNQCTENTADDERHYARLAATRAGIQLIEQSWSDPQLDDRVFALAKGPKPYPGDIYWWLERDSRVALARRTGAQAIWTGQGGDHLFWAIRPCPYAADYVATRGVDFGLLRVIGDTARLANQSYLSVLRSAFKLQRSRQRWLPELERAIQGHFVNSDAIPERCDEYISNPWTTSMESLPKVKQLQISLLADVLNRHKHMPGAEYAYQRHPLLSRPLMELCLQIPTYVLVQGGRRRALARSAFSDCVPAEIIARDDKGETSARVRAMIRKNEPFLRDVLLNGILVRERLVSAKALEAILVEGQSFRLENCWSLLACISGEIWAQTWSNSAPIIPAQQAVPSTHPFQVSA